MFAVCCVKCRSAGTGGKHLSAGDLAEAPPPRNKEPFCQPALEAALYLWEKETQHARMNEYRPQFIESRDSFWGGEPHSPPHQRSENSEVQAGPQPAGTL